MFGSEIFHLWKKKKKAFIPQEEPWYYRSLILNLRTWNELRQKVINAFSFSKKKPSSSFLPNFFHYSQSAKVNKYHPSHVNRGTEKVSWVVQGILLQRLYYSFSFLWNCENKLCCSRMFLRTLSPNLTVQTSPGLCAWVHENLNPNLHRLSLRYGALETMAG